MKHIANNITTIVVATREARNNNRTIGEIRRAITNVSILKVPYSRMKEQAPDHLAKDVTIETIFVYKKSTFLVGNARVQQHTQARDDHRNVRRTKKYLHSPILIEALSITSTRAAILSVSYCV
jgi:hypothetical protein